jgi:hypothetical protein
MPEFELVKRPDGQFIGVSQEDEEARRRFNKKREKMEAGEFYKVKVSYPRDGAYHRRFMKMLRFAFQQWEPEKERKRLTYKGIPIHKDFENFRKDIVILAGYKVAKFDARGRVFVDAASIAFDNMDDDTFRNVYAAVYEVIYSRIFEKKGYDREALNAALEEFEKFQPT